MAKRFLMLVFGKVMLISRLGLREEERSSPEFSLAGGHA